MESKSQYVTQKSGISKERVVNSDKISIIEELIKCSICLEILSKPHECESCGTLFCEDCINDWIKINPLCPLKCTSFQISKAKINTRKILNLLQLRCVNYPECTFTCDYWNMFIHETNCEFQKIKCANSPCDYTGSYQDLKLHLKNNCPYLNCECGFCKSKIHRIDFEAHLDNHYQKKAFNILNCFKCSSSENLRRCVCKKSICFKCLYIGKTDCVNECYVYHTGLRQTSLVYNISNYALPINFEAKLLFTSVDWVRCGITFNKEIINDQTDVNCPQYEVFCVLEDLVQFYTQNNGWKNCFTKGTRPLKAGDYMTITLLNGELRYAVNDYDLGSVIKIDMTKRKEMHLFVHTRNNKSKAEICYISEINN